MGPSIYPHSSLIVSTISFLLYLISVYVNRLPGAPDLCSLLLALPLLHHCIRLVDAQTEKSAGEERAISRERKCEQPLGAAPACRWASATAAEGKQQGGGAGAQKTYGPLLSDV